MFHVITTGPAVAAVAVDGSTRTPVAARARRVF
jgi:hypothetical protein